MLSPNTILQSRYRVVRRLGEGGMGTVYEAIDQRVSCVVALKETLAGQDSDSHRAFEREAALLANLRHPSLPKVMDYFTEERGEFLVMEFIPGNDLAELLEVRGGPFPELQVLTWAEHLLNVLEHLHGLTPPILHRDIKPANLKLTRQGEIFLLDFGLAKGAVGQMMTLQASKSIHGFTPVYAPLEQIHGQGTDERSDLYALGATLYHLLTGRAPTDAPTRFAAVDDDLPDPLRSVHEVNPEVDQTVSELIRQAMGIRRRSRFSSATAMLTALRNAKNHLASRSNDAHSSEAKNFEANERQQQERLEAAEQERKEAAEQRRIAEEEVRHRERETQRLKLQEEQEREQQVARETPVATIRADVKSRAAGSSLNSEEATLLQIVSPTPATNETPEQRTVEHDAVSATSASSSHVAQSVESNPYSGRPVKTVRATFPYPSSPTNRADRPTEQSSTTPNRWLGLGIGAALVLLVLVLGSTLLLWRTRGVIQPEFNANVKGTSQPGAVNKTPAIQPPDGMTYIPGGQFIMGRDDGDEFERPAHQVTVKPFFIDLDEVTVKQYAEFVSKTGRAAPAGWSNKNPPPGHTLWPVTNITWDDANAFAKWAGKRLPTEAEWEFAARGTDGRRYPWGNDWQDGLANVNTKNRSLANIGDFKGLSPFGLSDMVGNAWEWTSDKLAPYPGGEIKPTAAGVEMRVIRGGSYESDKNSATTTYRRGYPARGDFDRSKTGFRCVKDVS